MLEHTFCHLPGIGERIERELWGSGILSWDDFRQAAGSRYSPAWREFIDGCLEESAIHLHERNARYFSDLLAPHDRWRLFRHFRDGLAYLDIETNGLAGSNAYITAISVYDGREVRHYVRDINLRDFRDDIRRYRVIVTYNGTCFDLPFIENCMGLKIDAAHIDLRYVLRSLGMRGGLKECERHCGIDRGALDGMEGYSAVLLWEEYLRSDNEKTLETLLSYNVQDTLNLEALMVIAWNMKLDGTPFAEVYKIPPASSPPNPFAPDPLTIERILARRFAS